MPPTQKDYDRATLPRTSRGFSGDTTNQAVYRNDLTIEVWDSLGNASEMTLAGIRYDWKAPTISDLFPTGSGLTDTDGEDIAPTAPGNADNEDAPTINLVTKNPAFQINEELDSLSIRYHEEGGGTAIVQAWGPGHVRLETVDELVTWPVNDTSFVENQRYHLQILAFDLAHNVRMADGGILTFTEGFGNPDADMFKVVPDDALDGKQVAGVDVAITLSVLDTTLTRIEKEQDSDAADVRAVTYHTPSAVAVIVSGDQAEALEGVSFSGTGVSPALRFHSLPAELAALGMVAKAAILDGDGWHAGSRTVKFKSDEAAHGRDPVRGRGLLRSRYRRLHAAHQRPGGQADQHRGRGVFEVHPHGHRG